MPSHTHTHTHTLTHTHINTQGNQLHSNHGGWEAFKDDWHYFFDCMLAPSPRQAAAALEKLPIVPSNAPGAPASLQENLSRFVCVCMSVCDVCAIVPSDAPGAPASLQEKVSRCLCAYMCVPVCLCAYVCVPVC